MNTVERLFSALQRRDWDAVAAQLQPSVVTEYPATGERFTGADEYVISHRLRPEEIRVDHLEIISGEQQVAVYAVIKTPTATEHMMGFYQLQETRIARIVELWATAGSMPPPTWRLR